MEPLAGLDSAFLALERPSEHLAMGALMVLEPPDPSAEHPAAGRFAEVSALVASRVHLVRRFRQRVLGLGPGLVHPVWVDDPDFAVERHLRRAAVPEPGGPGELDGVVGDLMAVPLDHRLPLWEMVVLEGLAGGRSAVLARVHHAVLDGSSGAELLASFLDLAPEPRSVPAPDPFRPAPLPSRFELLRHGFTGLVRRPGLALDLFRRGTDLLAGPQNSRADAGGRPGGPTKVALLDEAFRAPHTSLNGPLSPQRTYASCRAPLDHLRRIGRQFGATVNDVVLAATGSALRRYLSERGETSSGSLIAMMPISTRRAARGEGGPPEGASQPGNMLTAVFLPLGTDLESPLERLRAVIEETREAKALDATSGGALLEDLSLLLPPVLIHPLTRAVGALAGVSWLPTLCNLVVSNIAGPDLTLWFAGRRVAEVYPVGPLAAGIGLNLTALSYLGTLHIGLLACRRRVPDPERLAALFRAGLEELEPGAPGR